MSETIAKHSIKTAAILAVFAVLGTAPLAFTYNQTKDIIAGNEKTAKLQLISQILPQDLYDNDLLKSAAELPPAPELGNAEATTVYRGTLGGAPSALVMEATAPDGYGGKIKLILGVRANGEIAGVRVISHRETPGLGDYIEIARSQWINVFNGKSLANTPDGDWKVKKDGGQFPHNTGATITPRAVVKAVHKALAYFGDNKEKLFALPPRLQEAKK